MYDVREVSVGSLSLEALQRLRGSVYVEEGFLKPDDLQDGRDVDEYDVFSQHVGVFLPTGEAVGTLRMIPAGGPKALQIQAYCGIDPDPSGAASVEASRFVVHPLYRKGVVTFSLMRWFIAKCKDLGVCTCYALVEEGLFKSFLSIGFPFEQIGGVVSAYGTPNLPIRVALDDMIPGVQLADQDRRIQLAPFLLTTPYEGLVGDEDLRRA